MDIVNFHELCGCLVFVFIDFNHEFLFKFIVALLHVIEYELCGLDIHQFILNPLNFPISLSLNRINSSIRVSFVPYDCRQLLFDLNSKLIIVVGYLLLDFDEGRFYVFVDGLYQVDSTNIRFHGIFFYLFL